jgi:hypothetical protein
MTTPHSTAKVSGGRRVLRFVRSIPMRLYGLAMIALVSWVSYRAFRYLVVSLLVPPAAPEQITGLPLRLDARAMTTTRDDWKGTTATLHPRSPLAHYHRIDTWIQPDLGNNCTTSGCHPGLPHAKQKEDRAFLNMHATSMHCGVCHFDGTDQPARLVWYDIADGTASGPPALLAALTDTLAADTQGAAATEAQRLRLEQLLRQAARDAGDSPQLAALADHLAASRAPSETYDNLVEAVRTNLPRHFRGEYGHKLAVADADGRTPLLAHPGTAALVKEFVSRPPPAGPQRDAMIKQLHPKRRETPRSCGDCHVGAGGMVDFAALGYPQPRVDALISPVVVRMIERIRDGQPFHLPGFVQRLPDAPADQPADAVQPPSPSKPDGPNP